MLKAICVAGIFIILYSLVAIFTGFPLLTDFLPVGHYGNTDFNKLVPGPSSLPDWVYSVALGIILVGASFILTKRANGK
jgi:hypothetical protein